MRDDAAIRRAAQDLREVVDAMARHHALAHDPSPHDNNASELAHAQAVAAILFARRARRLLAAVEAVLAVEVDDGA